MNKYKCLMLDHDDTAVSSSREIHYPAFIKTVETLRPRMSVPSLEAFMQACFYPGLFDYYTKVLEFTPEELELETDMWQRYVRDHVPHFFDGLGEILEKFKEGGGIIAVSSQSHRDVIVRDYRTRLGFLPDYVYGFEIGKEKSKPSPFAVFDVCNLCGIAPDEVLVVDDLRTGLEMAKSAKAQFAAAGWSHFVPEIRDYMKENSEVYLGAPSELEAILFE